MQQQAPLPLSRLPHLLLFHSLSLSRQQHGSGCSREREERAEEEEIVVGWCCLLTFFRCFDWEKKKEVEVEVEKRVVKRES